MIRDKTSPEWMAVKEHCESRLAELREENDNDYDPIETAKIRGKIAFAKEIIDLEKEQEQEKVKSQEYL